MSSLKDILLDAARGRKSFRRKRCSRFLDLRSFRFLDLPIELRQLIYYYALPRSLPKASTQAEDPFPDRWVAYPRLFSAWLSQAPSLGLLSVSRQISEEAIDAFLTNNTFDVWIPFVHESQLEIRLLPPVTNSWQGFPKQTTGRWFMQIPQRHWRAMRRVSVVFGGSGWVYGGAPRYEWHVFGTEGGHQAEPPDRADSPIEHYGNVYGCGRTELADDKRADNFSLLCDILGLGERREVRMTHLELVFEMSDRDCDKAVDVSNIRAVQTILCERLNIKTGGNVVAVTDPWIPIKSSITSL